MMNDMIKRFNNYLLNSMKIAILGFIWYGLFKFPWKSLMDAPLGGKIFVGVMMWAIWSFMVIIVSGELDRKSDEDEWHPIGTPAERKAAVEAGMEKGIPEEQLDF